MENDQQVAPDPIQTAETPSSGDTPEVSDARRASVKAWQDKLTEALEHWNTLGVFKRMKDCQRIAKTGSSEEAWITADKFVVPILARHINLSVSNTYAKNPTVIAKRKKRLLFQSWDGKSSSVQKAMEMFQAGDVSAAALLMDVAAGQDYIRMADRIARTVEIVWAHYLSEQKHNYKAQLKALVRRAKVNGVAYVKLGFQRQTGYSTEREGQIADARSKIADLQRLIAAGQKGEFDAQSKEMDELQSLIQDLSAQHDQVLREGPVLSFPRSTRVVPDTGCTHLKSFLGCKWVAEYDDMTPEDVKSIYGVDIETKFTEMKPLKGQKDRKFARVWHVQDSVKQQYFCLCEGYPDFIIPPQEQDVKLERFWTLFPLVFNECEDEENPFPLSDVWMGKHAQDEYNRSRESLRQHRIANQPWYGVRNGALEEKDFDQLSNHAPHAVLKFNGLGPDTKLENLIQRGPVIGIDPNQYDVESHMTDILRTVGSQEANLGPTSGATATESSIAENSRMSSQNDNVDDLDELMTELAHAGGHLCLAELSKETVVEIAGPGATWPEMPATREEVQKDLMLEVKAGSSGRPNRSAELADMERAFNAVSQLPGVNPEPLVKKYLMLLDLDPEETYVEGLPSITALNQAMGAGPQQQATGDPQTDPAQQGGEGGSNAPQPAENAPGAQPAYPQPQDGTAPIAGA